MFVFRYVSARLLSGAVAVLVGVLFSTAEIRAQTERRVVVVEESGGTIAGAQLLVRGASGVVLQQATTGSDGACTIAGLPEGRYWLEASARNFQVHRSTVELAASEAPPVRIVLTLAGLQSNVTVTAERGTVADIEETWPVVTVRGADDFHSRPLATIGNALEGGTGIMTQQSTYGQVSPFLRGLTGYQVLNLIDGVRFNNSTFRSGPNQYLAFVDPSQAQRVEVMLGPASSQFGSDALGGAIQVLTPSPLYASGGRRRPKGTANLFAASADQSAGADAFVSIAGKSFTTSVGGSGRRLDDLRGGQGRDSHHVLRRLFGLSDDQIEGVTGARQKGTGFTQSGFYAKATGHLAHQQNLTFWYQHSDMDDVRGYKDVWGGLGRLRSDFQPQGLDFFYTRYEKLGVGKLDWLSGTFSINSQRDGSIRQGLRSTDTIVQDDVGVDAFGYAVQAGAHIGRRQTLVFGGEGYDERVDAVRNETDPTTGAVDQKRARYPNGSRYRTTGVFVQDVVDLVRGSDRGALKLNLGGRFTRVDADTFAAQNVSAAGESLGVVDSSQSYQDWTYNAGLSWQATTLLTVNGLVGRGFRAPNLNDLGALGLNDLGYEVPASAALDAGSYIGSSDGEDAVSSGVRVQPLEAERLFNYEMGVTLRWDRLYARANVFDAELKDPIVRRSILFPLDSPPATLAGLPVTPITPTAEQQAQGVVGVASAFDPRAVKAFVNDGAARYYGVDALVSYRFSTRWLAEGNYSYLMGHDLNPTRPVRRLPPQQGFLSIRYQPGGRFSWVGVTAYVSGAQENFSGGDLTDERIGAARRRSDISDFFQGGLIRPYLIPGGDGHYGTADDVFAPTQETVAQIQDRVLPLGSTVNGVTVVDDATRVPLYTRTPAFLSASVGAGVTLARNLSLKLSVSNLFDRSYRVHGSGVDSPGVSAYACLSVLY
ncbi:MAG: TonB-dependent receptor [Luteitalea sp.]|nr:TonB-dependent receptor [Luteitalea sp.]